MKMILNIPINRLAMLVVASAFACLMSTASAGTELYVRASAHGPPVLNEQSAVAGPITAQTGPSTGTGGVGQGNATAGFGFLRISGTASTNGAPPDQSVFAGGGAAKFTDSITIDAPGRTGTRGRVTFRIRYYGRISALGGGGARASIDGLLRDLGDCCEYTVPTFGGSFEMVGDGNTVNFNFLGEPAERLIIAEFVFGQPFPASLEIVGGANVSPYSGGVVSSAAVDIGLSWQGIVGVQALSPTADVTGYTMTSESGANYALPITSFTTGAPPAQADLLVTSTDSPDPVADGSTVIYTTTIRNNGLHTATGIQGTAIGRNARFFSTTLPAGSYTRSGSGLNINLPDLASGEQTTFEIVLTANQPPPEKAQEVTFDVTFTSNAIDAALDNNSTKVTTGFSTPAPPDPPYYLDRLIDPPSDYVTPGGRFSAQAMNAQGYVAFDFDANNNDAAARRTPLIYTGPGKPFITLTWPGEIVAPVGNEPHINDISDVAPDGSFWVCGQYNTVLGNVRHRAVAWHVQADGTSTLYALKNVSGTNGVELSEGIATAINSSGEAIGYHASSSIITMKWALPDTTAHELSTPSAKISDEQDLQNDGLGVGTGGMGNYLGAIIFDVTETRLPMALPTINGRQIIPEAMKANRVVGHYRFEDATGPGGPFVYTLGDSTLTRLPEPVGLNGDVANNNNSGHSGNHINAPGDIVGYADNPPSIGNSLNPSGNVLWKRRPDGSYRVFTLDSIFKQNRRQSFNFPGAELRGIADDGTILLVYVTSGVEKAQLLRPGARPTNQPLNISTRMKVQTGNNVLIGGMIVTGLEPKTVVIRAMGPSLSSVGVPGALQDPILELYESGNLILTIDDWQEASSFFEPGQPGHGFQPSDSREAALVTSLYPGYGYTAIVRGKDSTTGVGLVEVYDVSSALDSQLANISTRGFVESGDNVMIGGFIIGGSGSRLLVRALGPSLTNAGVPDALQDPTLELFDGNGNAIAFNDNWRSHQEAEIIATTVPPNNDNEAAIVRTLAPGAYTAVLRGKNSTTGMALVEAYNLQ